MFSISRILSSAVVVIECSWIIKIMQNVCMVCKMANSIIPLNAILHTNLPCFQLIFVEDLHNSLYMHRDQIQNNTVFHIYGCQFHH